MRVAILGGTGSFGRSLAARLAAAGEDEVVIGSRNVSRALAAASELGGRASGATNDECVAGVGLAVLAVKADAALDTARGVSAVLGKTPLLCVASELVFTPSGVLPDPGARSIAERVQDLVSGPVVAGLHSLAASSLRDDAPSEDALVCGDDPGAKELALELAGRVVAGRALDAGPLASARTLEGLTAVLVNLNRRYKTHAGISVTGVRRA